MEEIIELRAEHVSFVMGEHEILQDINLALRPGEFFVIMGPNGCGKTSLLNLLAGLALPTRGSVEVRTKSGNCLDMRSAMENQSITEAFVFEGGGLISNLSIFENVALPLRYARTMTEAQVREGVGQMLTQMGLSDCADLRPAALSPGVRKRVQIARAKITRPDVVFFDDPVSGLDAEQSHLLRDFILELHREGGRVSVLATGSPQWEWGIADRVAFLQRGRLKAVGTKQELLAHPATEVRDFLGGVADGH